MTELKETVLPEMENEGKDMVENEIPVESGTALPADNESDEVNDMTDSLQEESDMASESDEPSADIETEEVKPNLSRQQIVERLETLINSSVEEVKDEIEYLKQCYYKLRKQEVESEKARHNADTQDDADTEFVPASDVFEERLKNALQVYK